MNQTLKNPTNPESFVIHRRIGSTTFKVNVHFNEEGRETLEEKALRLMKNELFSLNKSHSTKKDLHIQPNNAKMKSLQAGWLSERGSA
jgi:hypothetical protein